jgi:hypothetical protein
MRRGQVPDCPGAQERGVNAGDFQASPHLPSVAIDEYGLTGGMCEICMMNTGDILVECELAVMDLPAFWFACNRPHGRMVPAAMEIRFGYVQ